MMERWKILWMQRSVRERWLLAVMFALVACIILWLGVYRPVEAGLANARADHQLALERKARIAQAVGRLQQGGEDKRSLIAAAQLEQTVAQSAAEAGFTLERTEARGQGALSIAIASARPGALLSWLAVLERQGALVESITMAPSGASGTVTMQAVVRIAGTGQGSGT